MFASQADYIITDFFVNKFDFKFKMLISNHRFTLTGRAICTIVRDMYSNTEFDL